jgi:AcrR family transcriptional regulator
MADIGAEAGIVGSGIYRHFESKTAILVAMLDQVMDRLADRAAEIVAAGTDDASALSALICDHIEVGLADRDVLAVYHREIHTLPEDDRRRLRRRHRLYIEEWVHLLGPQRPDLADAELRLAVHAAIGAIHSTFVLPRRPCRRPHGGFARCLCALLPGHHSRPTFSELMFTIQFGRA